MAKADDFEPDDFEPDAPTPSGLAGAAGSPAAKFLAPMVGGMGGSAAGTAIGAGLGALGGPAAPVTVPLGAILGGMVGAGTGTAGAEMGRAGLAGEQIDPTAVRNQALMSAATDPVGKFIGPGVQALKFAKGAGGFGAAGKRFLAGISKEIELRYPGTTEVVEKIGVGQRGIAQADKALRKVNAEHKRAVRTATQAGAGAAPIDLMQPVLSVIDKLDEAGSPAAEMVRKRANAFFEALPPRSTFKLNANRILHIKQTAQDKVDDFYKSQAARRGAGKTIKRVGGKTAEINFQEALAKGAQQWLETNVPGSAELNQSSRALQGALVAIHGPGSRAARRGTARFVTAATTAAIPGGILPRVGAGILGYGVGHMAEPVITPALGAGLGAMQNPLVQQLLGQAPRAAGLGFQQAVSDQ